MGMLPARIAIRKKGKAKAASSRRTPQAERKAKPKRRQAAALHRLRGRRLEPFRHGFGVVVVELGDAIRGQVLEPGELLLPPQFDVADRAVALLGRR